MFFKSRERTMAAIANLGSLKCAYLPGHGDPVAWPTSRCDCKYGFTVASKPYSEQTGCPEMRSVYKVLEAMTDEEWSDFVTRARGVML